MFDQIEPESLIIILYNNMDFEKMVFFEKSLYWDDSDIIDEIYDVEFYVDRLLNLPGFRPFSMEKAVRLCGNYCKNHEFRSRFLEKSELCAILVFKLFKMGIFVFEEIEPYIRRQNSYVFCYYFRKEINDFKSFIMSKKKPNNFDSSFFENDGTLDLLIEYGFIPFSIEYCLKYDDISVFRDLDFKYQKESKWSPFEWSRRPPHLDFMSFSAFFGSINCFKHLLLNNYQINDEIRATVVYCGSLELFHLCNSGNCVLKQHLIISSRYCHLLVLRYLYENGADINSKNDLDESPLICAAQNGHLSIVEFLVSHGVDVNIKDQRLNRFYFPSLHFIGLQIMAINVLSNI